MFSTRVGLFDEMFYMYLEDADLGWKLRQMGRDCVFVPDAVVHHKYIPDAPHKHYEHLERNRWLLLLTYYKLPTLLLLGPTLLLMEAGQFVYAAAVGRLGAKLQSWAWFWRPSHLAHVRRYRRNARRRRSVRDRDFMGGYVGSIVLPTGNPRALALGIPLLSAYWSVTRRLIFW